MGGKNPKDFEILVIDSHPQTATFIATTLLNEGFRVSEAYNDSDALASCNSKRPDLVIVDVKMKVIEMFSGYKIIATFDGIPSNIRTTVKNVVGIIKKPVDSSKLVLVVKKALKL